MLVQERRLACSLARMVETKEHESHHTYTRQIAYAVNMWLYARVIDLSQKAGGVHNPLMYEQIAHEVQLEKEESHS